MQPANRDANLLAWECANRATEYDPNNYLLWERVGYLRFSVGDKEGADAAFARMNELRYWKKPPNTGVHF